VRACVRAGALTLLRTCRETARLFLSTENLRGRCAGEGGRPAHWQAPACEQPRRAGRSRNPPPARAAAAFSAHANTHAKRARRCSNWRLATQIAPQRQGQHRGPWAAAGHMAWRLELKASRFLQLSAPRELDDGQLDDGQLAARPESWARAGLAAQMFAIPRHFTRTAG
jgi:hypothetical protein